MRSPQILLSAAIMAVFLLSATSLSAQNGGPVYFAPKILWSHQKITGFENTINAESLERGTYRGGSASDNTFGGGFAVGYDFGAEGFAPFRTEFEFLMRKSPTVNYGLATNGPEFYSKHEVKPDVYSTMVNAYFDIRTDTAVTPYLGGGLGAAYIDTSIESAYFLDSAGENQVRKYNGSRNTTNFAWNVGGGVAFEMRENISLDLGYRYSDFGKLDVGEGNNERTFLSSTGETVRFDTKANLRSHEVILGLRISAF
ncbi:MAG: outer membrane protein [Candidatus Adiutrix sp.]